MSIQSSIATRSSRSGTVTGWLALGAVVGPILFTLASFALAPLHPGYSIVSQPISALAVGPDGWVMRSIFLLYGLLVAVGVVAVGMELRGQLGLAARWAGAVLLLLLPLAVLWAGIFTIDDLALHNDGLQAAVTSPVITLPIVGLLLRRAPRWRRLGTWMLVAGPLTLTLLIGFITSVPRSQMVTGGGAYGLWQRALGVEVFVWFVALGWLAFRDSRGASTREV